MSAGRITLSVLLLAALFVGYRLMPRASAPGLPAAENIVSESAIRPRVSPSPEPAKAVDVKTLDEPAHCLTGDDLRAHPLIRRMLMQMDAASVDSADIESFRGIDEPSVRAFAEQGDSAAMAVMGAIHVMRANGLDDSQAVGWLKHETGIERQGATELLSADAGLALNDAAFWFYESALHGRLFALQQYGSVRSELFGGAVGMGWLSQEEYDSLEAEQRTELIPANLYRRLALDLAPNLDLRIDSQAPRNDVKSEIAGRLRNEFFHEFHRALEDADLPPPEQASAATMQEIETLRMQMCGSDVQP